MLQAPLRVQLLHKMGAPVVTVEGLDARTATVGELTARVVAATVQGDPAQFKLLASDGADWETAPAELDPRATLATATVGAAAGYSLLARRSGLTLLRSQLLTRRARACRPAASALARSVVFQPGVGALTPGRPPVQAAGRRARAVGPAELRQDGCALWPPALLQADASLSSAEGACATTVQCEAPPLHH